MRMATSYPPFAAEPRGEHGFLLVDNSGRMVAQIVHEILELASGDAKFCQAKGM